MSQQRLTKHVWFILVFTLGYLICAVPLILHHQNYEFVLYIAVTGLLVILISYVHLHTGLSVSLLWGLSFWGLMHVAGGLMVIPYHWPIKGEQHVLYNLWLIPGMLKFDQLVHAYGFGMVTWLCWQCLRRILSKTESEKRNEVRPSLGLLTISVAGGMGFGALNEVIEFAATMLVPETNVGGYTNTSWDLVANAVGTVLAALFIWAGNRHIPS